MIDYLLKYRPVQIENLVAAKAVLDKPLRIYSRIRPIASGGWCYVGRPDRWKIREGCEVPFSSDKVFAVYMADTMEVYAWRAEYADVGDSFAPKDWQSRFGGLRWKCP